MLPLTPVCAVESALVASPPLARARVKEHAGASLCFPRLIHSNASDADGAGPLGSHLIRSMRMTAVGSISHVLPSVLPTTVRRMSTLLNTSESNSRTLNRPVWFVATVQCG